MIGKTLVHYEISAEIGKGGMGEVYQAKDTKLGRDVAIKVLPEEFALDKDRVARFQREAKLLASLNHPNIAAIYGLEESDGTHFLVMELIEGDTLRDRIKSGPIPVEEALKLGLQMAEALEAAHEKGVIHRDLKPANIKVTPDGKVKILDFGLAKAYAGDQENMSPMDSPTISAAATQQGVILGTAAYMSPEQAKGKSVDKRADIWAFGVVFFEMLTGRQSFIGETASETLASVMKSEPEWDSLQPNLHSRIRLLLERCLEKDPKNRYSGISDARVDIQKVLADPGGVFVQPIAKAETKAKLRQMLVWVSIVAILTIITAVVVWNLKTKETDRVMEIEYVLPDNQQLNLDAAGRGFLAVSPDGSQFVYGTTQGLYCRSVDKFDTRLIYGSEGNSQFPFFSPDGQWIGYYSALDQKLKKIAISGGVPAPLCNIDASFAGAQWCPDNTIIFSLIPGGIMKIPDSGGTPEPLIEAELSENGGSPILPQILPDGRNILFTNFIDPYNLQIMIHSLETGKSKTLFPGQTAHYLPTGHLLYAFVENDSTNLFARKLDLDRLEAIGGAVPLVEGVSSYSVSDSGTLIYIQYARTASQSDGESNVVDPSGRTLCWVDRSGNEELIPAPPKRYKLPKISPDGSKVALTVGPDFQEDIWIWDLFRQNQIKLTFNEMMDKKPIWTPDSRQIIYARLHEGPSIDICWKAANGTGEVETLFSIPDRVSMPSSISKDGKTLLIIGQSTDWNNIDIGKISMEGNGTPEWLLEEEYMEATPQISPDGRWMAYFSNESGSDEIYVRPFPEIDKDKWQVSTSGGQNPLWSPDGRELFYITFTNNVATVMAVAVDTEPMFSVGKPKVLFKGNYISGYVEGLGFDIDPNTGRFLMIKPAVTEFQRTNTESRKINIVLNWDEELKQRVPVD
jgi:Tol biopolymer transport system component/predicted Ser/Thr protein kinase